MKHVFRSREEGKGATTLYFEGDVESLSDKVNDFLTTQGYTLKKGLSGNGEYSVGNYILRLLFGAFVKYYKFSVSVAKESTGLVAVTVRKAHSGFSGGVIGMAKLNKELKRLGAALEGIDDNLGMYQPTR